VPRFMAREPGGVARLVNTCGSDEEGRLLGFRTEISETLRLDLPFFAPRLLALRIRGGQSDRNQRPDGIGTRWETGLPAPPLINFLSPLWRKPNTDGWSLPTPRATALFSYYVIRVCHKPYYEKICSGEMFRHGATHTESEMAHLDRGPTRPLCTACGQR
jgi:hypothetical protein